MDELRLSAERLRLAMQDANVAVWEYDFVAGSMTRTDNHDGLYGLAPQETWVIETFLNATHPEDRHLANHYIQKSVVKGGPDDYAFDFRVVWPDQSIHWLYVTGHVARRNDDGVATLVRGTITDVTERKRIEAELRSAVKLRDEFVQIASHELNTPLTALTLNLGKLSRDLQVSGATDEVLQRLARVERQVSKMGEFVKQLLDVGRLSSGRVELALSATSLAEVVRGVVDDFTGQAQRAGCVLTLEVKADAVGQWDRARLAQVASNIVMNALKYGAGKPVHVVVDADSTRDVPIAKLTVEDRGPGIDESEHARIFDKFGRAPATRSYGGLGLGLYVAREIVVAHGGTIGVVSRRGEGARFEVELPLARPQASAPPPAPSEAGTA